jgi:hypothetical protein
VVATELPGAKGLAVVAARVAEPAP